jgi:hypothetical protein
MVGASHMMQRSPAGRIRAKNIVAKTILRTNSPEKISVKRRASDI